MSTKFDLNSVMAGLGALTGNPATAALLQIGASFASAMLTRQGVQTTIDSIQLQANKFVDAIQEGHLPDLRADEPRHQAAVALAIEQTPVPAAVAQSAPSELPKAVVAT